MPLFEVALIEKPTKKEAEDGEIEKLILSPTPVLARDDQAAFIQAVNRLIKGSRYRAEVLRRVDPPGSTRSEGWWIGHDAHGVRVQVLVRPFA
jgi:hypothetical protein|tara:strand:+ start:627 stop:905 length:279 start_codon:yes stop_codon:yes gene_type:complete